MDRALQCSWKYSYAFVKAMYDWRIKLVMSNDYTSYDAIADSQLDGVDITDEWVYAVRNWETEASLEDYKESYYDNFEPNLDDFEYCEDDDYYYYLDDWDYEIVNNENLLDCIADIEDYYETALSEDDKQRIETVFNCAQEYKKQEKERREKAEEKARQQNSYKVYSHI